MTERIWDLGISGMGLTGDKTTAFEESKRNTFITERVIDNGEEGFVHICANDIIDQIKKIREENNDLWMDILKIGFKYAPQETAGKMMGITENDMKISKLSKQLGELK